MKKFNEAFAPYGLPKTAIKPSYGMAEATLFVSATKHADEAKVDLRRPRRAQRGPHGAWSISTPPNAIAQVSCGYVARSQWAAIVDPRRRTELPDGHVGEIWLHGENMGVGYWGRAGRDQPRPSRTSWSSACRGQPRRGQRRTRDWMRTGDYGVYFDGELYITGRVKDLVIVDGRNHYPQDMEFSAQEASTALRPGFIAAFSVPAQPASRRSCSSRAATRVW